MNSKISGLKPYSLGIVKVDKDRNTDIINVIPIEELTLLDGDIINNTSTKHTNSLPNKDGVIEDVNVVEDNYITAKWIPYGHSNRATSPDVIKGETVMMFRYMDTDEYYWTTIFTEPSIRRKETVVYSYGDLKDGNVPLDKDSTYYLKVSTHDKVITLHTSKSDGEPYEYDVTLDTGEGVFTITDNIGNDVVLDSRVSKVTITTNSDVEVNTDIVTINAASSMNINTPILNISNDLTVGGTQVFNGHATFNGGTTGDNIGAL